MRKCGKIWQMVYAKWKLKERMQGDMWFKHLYNFEKLIFGSAIFRFVADDCIENDVLQK